MRSCKITIVSDQESWINDYIPEFISKLKDYHQIKRVHNLEGIQEGDYAFFLSFSKIVPKSILEKNRHNIVVHESDLPKGKGWSPLTWQILEGKNEIPIVLFEATEKVDSGVIYLKDSLFFDGTELVDKLRECQGKKTIEMCLSFVGNYDEIINNKANPQGESSHYQRRRPKDSKLDVDKSIREQFNLLRVVDNEKYPAYFEINGKKYILKIEEERD